MLSHRLCPRRTSRCLAPPTRRAPTTTHIDAPLGSGESPVTIHNPGRPADLKACPNPTPEPRHATSPPRSTVVVHRDSDALGMRIIRPSRRLTGGREQHIHRLIQISKQRVFTRVHSSPVVSLSLGILHEWMRTQMLAKPSSHLLQRTGGDHRGGRAQPG